MRNRFKIVKIDSYDHEGVVRYIKCDCGSLLKEVMTEQYGKSMDMGLV